MRVVMTMGEVLRRATAARATEVLGPHCRILNQWGPGGDDHREHLLGGNSLLLLSMIDEVRRSVMEQGQKEFMDELARIIRDPTLSQVSGLVREIRERVQRV